MRAARIVAVCLGLGASAATVARLEPAARAVNPAQMNDALPLWIGAWALREGQDPQSEAVQRATFARHPTGARPGGFFNPYPPTAALFTTPGTLSSWEEFGRAWAVVLAVAAGMIGGLAACAGPLRDRWIGLGGALVVSAIVATHPGLERCFQLGNVNPLMLALLAGGLAAIGQGWDRAAAVLLTLGAGWKIAPVALVGPALLARRWRPAVGVALGLALCAAIIVLVYHPPIAWDAWWAELRRTSGFYWKGFDVEVPGRELRRPAFVATGALITLVAWRRTAVAEATVLGVALLGLLSIYSPFSHEGVLVMPALGAILGAPLRRGALPLDLALALLVGGLYAWAWPTSPEQDHQPLRWVAFGWTLWGAALVRYAVALVRPA